MIRKLQGLYFEDFHVGDRFETPGRTVTDADISAYAGLSADYNPIHLDENYAKQTIYGGRIAHGMLTLTIGLGAFMRLGTWVGTGMGLLGVNAKFLRPVKAGDTLVTLADVTDVRSTSKPDRGVITFQVNIMNQSGETVCQIDYKHMVRKKGE